MAEVNGMLSALSWPLRSVKEQVSGDEGVWFEPEGMNPHVYAAINTAGDLLLDPLNAVPVGLFGKLGKAAGDLKGAVTGAFPNYIPNFYGLTDGAADVVKPHEKLAAQAIQKATGRSFGEALGSVRAAEGFAGTAAKGVSEGIKNVATPSRRAAVREGINPGAQKHVQGYLDDIEAGRGNKQRLTEKASGNVNYANHVRNQAGSAQPVTPAMAEVAHRSNLESYTPNRPGQIREWMQKNAGTEATGDAVRLSDSDASLIEDHVLGSWKGADTVVMKRARSPGTGGNHYTDMYAGRSPMARPVASEVVRLMNKHGDDWAKYMPEKGKNWSLKKVNDDGSVWVDSRGRNVGTAITEGGVNWLAKIDRDGTIMSVISDKHDFLEKIPVLGKEIEKALPKSLVAVTPPMFTNVKNMMRKQAKDLPAPERAVSGVARKKKSKEQNAVNLLEEYATQKPSQQAVARERMLQAGMLTSGVAGLSNTQE